MLTLSVRVQIRKLLCLCLYSQPLLRRYLEPGYGDQHTRYLIRHDGHPDFDRDPFAIAEGGESDEGLFWEDGVVK